MAFKIYFQQSGLLMFIITGLLLILTAGCLGGKKVSSQSCEVPATVKDFRHLDGCRFLFVLDDGSQLFADNLRDLDYQPVDGQRVRISYEELENFASVCMAEDLIVRINCIEIEEQPCANTHNPMKVDWIRDLEKKYTPSQIIKFEMEEAYAYHFKSKKKSYLYDCRGQLLCETDGAELGQECQTWTQKLKNPVVIWVVDY